MTRVRVGRPGRHTAGAAYVEFLIAFMPIFVTFVGLWELGEFFVTRLVVKHAAFAAARAAAVYIPRPDDAGEVPNAVNDGSWTAVNDAVTIAVAPVLLRGWLATPPLISFPANLGPGAATEQTVYSPDQPSMVNVRLRALYACHFPPIDLMVCRFSDDVGALIFPIEAHASFPYQGARYKYDPL